MREQEIQKLSFKVKFYSVVLALICAFWFMSTAVVLTTGAAGDEQTVTATDTTSTVSTVSTASTASGSSTVSQTDYQKENIANPDQSIVSSASLSKGATVKVGTTVISGDAMDSVYVDAKTPSADDKKAVVAALKELKITTNYKIYDISLKYGVKTASLASGKLKVTLKTPSGWTNMKNYDVAVYHYADKKLSKVKLLSADNKTIVFETDGCSPFAISRSLKKSGGDPDNPKTGDLMSPVSMAGYLAALSVFLIAVVGIKLTVAKGRLGRLMRF